MASIAHAAITADTITTNSIPPLCGGLSSGLFAMRRLMTRAAPRRDPRFVGGNHLHASAVPPASPTFLVLGDTKTISGPR